MKKEKKSTTAPMAAAAARALPSRSVAAASFPCTCAPQSAPAAAAVAAGCPRS